MLSAAELAKIQDEGYGDCGFNDPVPDLDDEVKKPKRAAASTRSEFRFPANAAANKPGCVEPATIASIAKETSTPAKAPAPYSRRAVIGATAPPADGQDLERYEITQAMDQDARSKGYKDYEEYSRYLQEQAGPQPEEVQPETPLAPGIKKAPAYMPPGAYPGDRTKLGKEYEKENRPVEFSFDPWKDHVKHTYVKQAETRSFDRVSEGNRISFRTEASGPEQTQEVGGQSLPWALEIFSKRLKVGDIVELEAEGEYAFADDEEFKADVKRAWRFELVSVKGKSQDKFALSTDERIDRANELRLRGNDMFKKNRLLRAMDYYERGSSLMDVLEAEDLGMPGHTDKKAAATNQRIWQCQKPLALNWGLILMKKERWQEAERKFTEVLMDIDKLNVKAIYRRGVCNLNIFDEDPSRTELLDQARYDLRRSAELDTSIKADVDREMAKVEKRQKDVDQKDEAKCRKVVEGYTYIGDERSVCGPAPEPSPQATPTDRLMQALEAQDAAADDAGLDTRDHSYALQREAIYNQFLRGSAPVSDD